VNLPVIGPSQELVTGIHVFTRISLSKKRFGSSSAPRAYNTFNHTQYSTIGSSITFNAAGQNTNTQFGQVTATRNPRYMQLALRVIF
jgi:hypothetical protein